jgi:hypothetical protein
MLENKRKEGTHDKGVKSGVMAMIYSCEIKPNVNNDQRLGIYFGRQITEDL